MKKILKFKDHQLKQCHKCDQSLGNTDPVADNKSFIV